MRAGTQDVVSGPSGEGKREELSTLPQQVPMQEDAAPPTSPPSHETVDASEACAPPVRLDAQEGPPPARRPSSSAPPPLETATSLQDPIIPAIPASTHRPSVARLPSSDDALRRPSSDLSQREPQRRLSRAATLDSAPSQAPVVMTGAGARRPSQPQDLSAFSTVDAQPLPAVASGPTCIPDPRSHHARIRR